MTNGETEHFRDIYGKYSGDIYRICLIYLKSREDAEEAVMEAFLRLMEKAPRFENDAHEKAWLTKTAVNICKDIQKSAWRKNVVANDEVLSYMTTEEEVSIMEDVLALPPKYRVVIYMHYYQGYKAAEIGRMLNMKEYTVLSRLSRGRDKLREELIMGGVFNA